MNQIIRDLEAGHLKTNIPYFRPGDTVRVSVKIREGEKERVQDYEGLVIGRRGSGIRETFMVRRVSLGVGMERVFQLHSPRIEEVKVIRRGKVRRAKLYYLRDLRGKRARLVERRVADNKLAAEAASGGKARLAQIETASSNAPKAAAPAAEAPQE